MKLTYLSILSFVLHFFFFQPLLLFFLFSFLSLFLPFSFCELWSHSIAQAASELTTMLRLSSNLHAISSLSFLRVWMIGIGFHAQPQNTLYTRNSRGYSNGAREMNKEEPVHFSSLPSLLFHRGLR